MNIVYVLVYSSSITYSFEMFRFKTMDRYLCKWPRGLAHLLKLCFAPWGRLDFLSICLRSSQIPTINWTHLALAASCCKRRANTGYLPHSRNPSFLRVGRIRIRLVSLIHLDLSLKSVEFPGHFWDLVLLCASHHFSSIHFWSKGNNLITWWILEDDQKTHVWLRQVWKAGARTMQGYSVVSPRCRGRGGWAATWTSSTTWRDCTWFC